MVHVAETIDEEKLSEVISEDVSLRLVEPGIYSVYPPGAMPGAYDSFGASTIYDLVACNRFYNRLMWGYAISEYGVLCAAALSSSIAGWALDLACGSLAFTKKLYAGMKDRPVLLLDQSLHLLRKAKSRLVQQTGKMPVNLVFLHADARQLPFKTQVFSTIIALNLLHCLPDVSTALKELKRVLRADGSAVLTTLVMSGIRWSDGYLRMLAGSGALVPRSADQLLSAFDDLDMAVRHRIQGNLMFINYRQG